MENEKYLNYFIELLKKNLNEAFIANIQMQCNVRINEEKILELQNKISELQNSNSNLVVFNTEKEQNFENKNKEHDKQIKILLQKIHDLNLIKNEYENEKHKLIHLENFRKELINVREENELLKKELSFFKNKTTTKKNKSKKEVVEVVVSEIEDGGTF